MKKRTIALMPVLLLNIFVSGQPVQTPRELKPFVWPGYEVMDLLRTDLNGDNLPDYVLVLKILGEDTLTFDNSNWEAARPLLLITRQADGKLSVASTNKSLVLCKHCGGVMGDPYQGIHVFPGGGGFTIDFYGGSSWRWGSTYTFRYDKAQKNWYLQSHKEISFHAVEPETTTEESLALRAEIGDITLDQFTPGYNADSSRWKVAAAKTYFFPSPDVNAKPKKAYLVKGNQFTSYRNFKNFVGVSFTNEKGTTTSGFLLKKDLLLQQAITPRAVQ